MPHMSNELKNTLASHVYEGVRSQLMVAAPAMKAWDELESSEQAQCREAMRLWLDGLGSNEVAEAWFERSGQFPRAMWGQLPEGPDRNVFIMAALDLLEWQRVWNWANSTTLAPFLLSQTPLREQIEQEGITDALGATTWHSQLGGAMNTYVHPFRCYLNEVDPPHGGYELWDIDNQRAHRVIWDNDEPWVEPQSMTYPYAIPAWVQEAIIRVNLLRTTWVSQAEFLAVLQMCNPASHDSQPLVDLELDGLDQALPTFAPPRIYAALADLIAGIEQAGEDTANTDRWWYVTVRKPDVVEATRRIVALGYQVVEDN